MKEELNLLEIGKRIKKLIKDKGITQTEFCKLAEISRNTLTNYIAGERLPETKIIYKIAKELNTTIEHILTGNYINISLAELSEEEKNLIEIYNKLSEKNKGKVEMFIEMKLDEQENDSKSKDLQSYTNLKTS